MNDNNFHVPPATADLDFGTMGLLVRLCSMPQSEKLSEDCYKIVGINHDDICACAHIGSYPVLNRLLKNLRNLEFVKIEKIYGRKRGVTMCYLVNLDPSNTENDLILQKSLEREYQGDLSADLSNPDDDKQMTIMDIIDDPKS